ncbi:hypothetical protein HOLleu_20216 [Holothuria leucospilota]|uniref:Uncharacterized protein n=1 Tax=Holothuria leucospilota TaxID=206669 RepID=A0A9Q1C0H2_HOLLE|nr:hypothetical protein HOLleu_20216 [Holothuria leucospilota]
MIGTASHKYFMMSFERYTILKMMCSLSPCSLDSSDLLHCPKWANETRFYNTVSLAN